MVAGVELNYNTGASALQMAQEIFGDGITITGATYTGDSRASAIYSSGDSISPNVVPGDTGVILSTGQAAAFTTTNAAQSNVSTNTTTGNTGPNNITDFTSVAGASTFDASILDISFVPDPGITSISIKFVFASEEYPEFSNSIYNDLIGIWSNGNLVPLAVGDGLTSVGNINQFDSANLFVDNTADQFNTEMDGFTLTLSLDIPVNPGVTNTLRIGITDVADSNFDSNLLIAGDSIQGTLVATDDSETITVGGTKTFDPLANDVNSAGGSLTITHINGVNVTANSSVTLSTGQIVTLNGDGTFTVETDLDVEEVNFTYTVSNGAGSDDVGLVSINTIPCFVAGTRILTPDGEVPVEALCPGDLVVTHDDGARPLIWTGSRRVEGRGTFAPIRIDRHALGNYRPLLVSPQHRVVIRDPRAELMFGSRDVLVAAKHLVNDRSIHAVEMDDVTYVHILFDRHQIVFSEGLLTESLLPGEMALRGCDDGGREEIEALFPTLDTGANPYGPAARRILKAHEADALLREELAV